MERTGSPPGAAGSPRQGAAGICRGSPAHLPDGLEHGRLRHVGAGRVLPRASSRPSPPSAAAVDPAIAPLLKGIPIWVFHGAQDTTVPLSESQRMVDALKACGSDVRFTIYFQAGHDAWTQTYESQELYNWFLGHVRG